MLRMLGDKAASNQSCAGTLPRDSRSETMTGQDLLDIGFWRGFWPEFFPDTRGAPAMRNGMIAARLFLSPIALVAFAVPGVRADVFPELGAYSSLGETLAADPARSAELAFVRAGAARLNRSIDRTASTPELIARFDREFSAITTHPVTRLALATIILNQGTNLTGADMMRAESLLADLKFTQPALRALHIKARANLAHYYAFGRENDFDAKAELLALLAQEVDSPWLRDSPELALKLFSPFLFEPGNPCGKRQDIACNAKFIAFLESIPAEKRTWAMQLTIGKYRIDEAWRKRGARWASETSPEQFAGFHAELALAGPALRAALALRPEESSPTIHLMTIAMADADAAGGDVAHWMSLARKIDPDNHRLLTRFAASNMARWGGDTSAIIACYEELLRSRDFDTPAPAAIGDVIHPLLRDLNREERIRWARRLATDFIPVANEYTRRFNETGRPLVGFAGHPINYRAIALAYLADADLLAEAPKLLRYSRPGFREDSDRSVDSYRLEHLGHGFSRALACAEANDFNLIEEYLPTLRTKSADASTPEKLAARQAGDAVDLAHHGDPAWLADYGKRLESMSGKVTSPAAKAFLGDVLALNRMERDFLDFQTVRLPFSDSLWEKAKWIGTFDGETAVADHTRHPVYDHFATFRGHFNPPYELRVRINSAKYIKWPHVGVHVGRCVSGYTGRSFVLESDTGRTYSMPPKSPLNKAKFRSAETPVGRVATLTVRIFPHGYAVALDDHAPMRRRDDTFRPFRISVGALPGYTAYGRFEYSDLTIRRIRPEEMSAEELSWMAQAPSPAAKQERPAAPELASVAQ